MRVALCLGLARAAGLAGMVGGQMLDIDAEQSTAPLSVEEIRLLQAMKTGALLKFSVEAGAILAGAGASARAALGVYGRAIGAAFQIADDILDVESDAATLGKRAGKDAEQNKGTLVGALGSKARAASSTAWSTRRSPRLTQPKWAPRATCCARPRASSPCGRSEVRRALSSRPEERRRARLEGRPVGNR